MTDSTAPDAIPYPEGEDFVADIDEFLLTLATRLQALFEDQRGGTVTITPSAINTPTTDRVNFGHTYTLGDPHVVVCLAESVAAPDKVAVWVNPGSVDSTGFDLGIVADSTAARNVTWVAVKTGTYSP